MSQDQSPHQPGPYGGPPGQYGAARSPVPGNPYAQQPPSVPYPTSYGSPYATPAPAPAAPGPRRSRAGYGWAAFAAITLLATGAVLRFSVFAGGTDSAYRLTTPDTVAETYQRQGAGTDSGDLTDAARAQLRGQRVVDDPHPVTASYETADRQVMSLSGVWGTVGEPDEAADLALTAVVTALQDDGDGSSGNQTEAIGTPERFTPAGFDGDVLKCQSIKFTSDKGSMDAPACVWGDRSTLGVTVMADPAAAAQGGDMDLKDAAVLTVKVREDALVEIDN